jgi:hypothetical protein
MFKRLFALHLLLTFAAGFFGASGAEAQQLRPSSDVLLPYFEVELRDSGTTTLLAVGNALGKAVEGELTLHTNWGIQVSNLSLTWAPYEVKSFDLRTWLQKGNLPTRTLRAAERTHLEAALSGQPSPQDGLYYSTEVKPGLAVGSVRIRTKGSPRPAALWGDYFVVGPGQEAAMGDDLVNLDQASGCPGTGTLCERHALRFLGGTGFDDETRFVIWTGNVGHPSKNANPKSPLAQTRVGIYNEAGQKVREIDLPTLPAALFSVAELGLEKSFGWLDLRTNSPSFIAVHHGAMDHSGIALQAYCLPEEIRQGPGIEIEKLTNGHEADIPPGPSIAVGDAVVWEYIVRNTGDVRLTDVQVTDDQGVRVSCPGTILDPGETMTCTGKGKAEACQYLNVGKVVASPPDGPEITAEDLSHYFGQQEAGIEIEKATNGQDADAAPGPTLAVGSPVKWTYKVTNTGKVDLTDLKVTDDQGVAVSCPKTTLKPKESMTCTGSGTATAGQYQNTGTVTAKTACGSVVEASDPSHYFGREDKPGLEIRKLTNGKDCDTAPGETIPVGSPVLWEYIVTNTGNVVLNNVKVTDDQGVAVSCPKTTLQPGESMRCTGTGVAVACQYRNIGTATGKTPGGGTVQDQDASHYFGQHHAAIRIEKRTNGEDADVAPGPTLQVGSPVQWTYVVTNTGDVTLTGVSVSDDRGVAVSCPKTTLQKGESMTCTGHGTATAGQYRNVGTVTAAPPCGPAVSDSDPSHYLGQGPQPAAIDIEKYTNGEDADVPTGPTIFVGDPVLWTYIVTNTGQVALSNVRVTDDRGVAVSCPKTTLQVGESMTCTGNGTATAGQYKNIGTVTGTPPSGPNVTDSDPSHYFGQEKSSPKVAIDIEKYTNGEDADVPTGPTILVGDPVLWTYIVTNTGEVALSNVRVTDDRGVAVSCPKTTLQVGESMTCTGNGTATAGQYKNVGTATGTPPSGGNVTDSDPSHYYGQPKPPTGGSQGCTPGYWKNHPDSWNATGYRTSQRVDSVFGSASVFSSLGTASLIDALSFKGGSSLEGAAGNLLRAAVAALLDASHPNVAYPRTPAGVIAEVNTALASGSRDTLLSVAAALDRDNNLGCPLN